MVDTKIECIGTHIDPGSSEDTRQKKYKKSDSHAHTSHSNCKNQTQRENFESIQRGQEIPYKWWNKGRNYYVPLIRNCANKVRVKWIF